MSFVEQERALFDLLFDRGLRERFAADRDAALSVYQLDAEERRDFEAVRADALALDALMRTDLVLSYFCRAFPLSFSILSSLPGGFALLKSLVDTRTMRMEPDRRVVVFGARLRDGLAQSDFGSDRERAAAVGIVAAELAMAETGAALKQAAVERAEPELPPVPLAPDWMDRPLKLASYVCAVEIPRPYEQLKDALCPGASGEWWATLSRNPLSAAARRDALRHADIRLLVAKAHLGMDSRCDPTVEQRTVELSEGYAPLFPLLDGRTGVQTLLVRMKSAGATDVLLKSIEAVFARLLDMGMLEVAG